MTEGRASQVLGKRAAHDSSVSVVHQVESVLPAASIRHRIRGKQAAVGSTPSSKSDAARFPQHVDPGRVSRLSQAFRHTADRASVLEPQLGELGRDEEQYAVGADSLTAMPTDLLRRAKAGDHRVQVVEDSATASSNA